MKYATLAQGAQIQKLLVDMKVTEEQARILLESGLLTDLLQANLMDKYLQVSRNNLRRLLGEESITSIIPSCHPQDTKELLTSIPHQSEIVDAFPYRDRSTAEVEFIGFDQPVNPREAIPRAKGWGLEQPLYEDALAIAYLFPQQVKEDTIFLHEPVRVRESGGEIDLLIAFIEGRVVEYPALAVFSRRYRFCFVRRRGIL